MLLSKGRWFAIPSLHISSRPPSLLMWCRRGKREDSLEPIPFAQEKSSVARIRILYKVVMSVGMLPYEQNILHSIAPVLIHLPIHWPGVPPVSEHCQWYGATGDRRTINTTAKKRKGSMYNVDSRRLLTVEFATMLRCSHLRSTRVPVDKVANRVTGGLFCGSCEDCRLEGPRWPS